VIQKKSDFLQPIDQVLANVEKRCPPVLVMFEALDENNFALLYLVFVWHLAAKGVIREFESAPYHGHYLAISENETTNTHKKQTSKRLNRLTNIIDNLISLLDGIISLLDEIDEIRCRYPLQSKHLEDFVFCRRPQPLHENVQRSEIQTHRVERIVVERFRFRVTFDIVGFHELDVGPFCWS
jgi:hypothetical protein